MCNKEFEHSFKKKYSVAERKAECDKIIEKYPTRIPTIIENGIGSTIQSMSRKKFLLPFNITVSQLISIFRKKISLNPCESIFIFMEDNTIPIQTSEMADLYKTYKNKDDGFLYITYKGENTFGDDSV